MDDRGDRLEEAFENAANGSVRAAVSEGRLQSVGDVQGTTIVARAARISGEVRFHFHRAMVGVYDSAFGTPQVGAYVSIGVELVDCGTHDKLRLVQVCREVVRGPDGRMLSVKPRDESRAERSGYSEPDARSLGWRVDQNLAHPSVYWSDGGRRDGHDGSSERAARLLDAPASLPDRARPPANVGKEFRTCAISDCVVLACVAWGYYIDDHGTVMLHPAPPFAYSGAGSEVLDAIDRWERIPGHAQSGIAQPAGTSFR